MTQKEYKKYNQEKYDKFNKLLNIGDTVIVNNLYSNTPNIGKVKHFTESGNVAVEITYTRWNNKESKYMGYRDSRTLIKFNNNQ